MKFRRGSLARADNGMAVIRLRGGNENGVRRIQPRLPFVGGHGRRRPPARQRQCPTRPSSSHSWIQTTRITIWKICLTMSCASISTRSGSSRSATGRRPAANEDRGPTTGARRLASRRRARVAAGGESTATSRHRWPGGCFAASARRRLLTLLGRVRPDGSPAHAEALAEFLAMDLVCSESIGKFRTIARGIREGLVDPRTVRAAWKAAKKPGVPRTGTAALGPHVAERSPGLAQMHAARRRDPRHWFQ